LDTYRGTLKALNPKDVLNRGYAIVYSLPEGGIVQSVKKVDKGHRIEVEVSDGRFDAVVEKK